MPGTPETENRAVRARPGRVPRAGARRLLWACVALAGAGLFAEPAQAQSSIVLVSNADGDDDGRLQAPLAQRFTTGPTGGDLSRVGIRMHRGEDRATTMKLRENNNANRPGSEIVTVPNPTSLVDGWNLFDLTEDVRLKANTRYWITVNEDVASNLATYTLTDWNGETGQAGWSIADSILVNTGWGNSSTGALDFTLRGTLNTVPTLDNPIDDQIVTSGWKFELQFPSNTFADADTGDTLEYTATRSDDAALPSWLDFDAATGTFSGTPTDADAGTLTVKVTADDGAATVSDEFDIAVSAATTGTSGTVLVSNTEGIHQVNHAFVFAQRFTTGASGSLSAVGFTVRTGEGRSTVVRLRENNASDRPGALIDTLDPSSALAAGINVFTAPVPVRLEPTTSYWITVNEAVSSDRAAYGLTSRNTETGETDWRIADDMLSGVPGETWAQFDVWANSLEMELRGAPNTAPTLEKAIGDQTAMTGRLFEFAFPPDTFADDAGDTLTYTATRSDGTALPAWLSFDAAAREFSGTPGDVGVLTVKVTATDTSDASAFAEFDIAVRSSDDATLSALDLEDDAANAVALDPVFDPATERYAASVASAVARVTFLPETTHDAASVVFLDVLDAALDDADGVAGGHQVDVGPGATTVKVQVTAQDAATIRTYVVAVTRALPAECASDAAWCATLTAGESLGGGVGYCQGAGISECGFGSVDDDDFEFEGAGYKVESVRCGGGQSRVHLTLDRDLPPHRLADLALRVGTDDYALADAGRGNMDGDGTDGVGVANNYRWDVADCGALVADADVVAQLLDSGPPPALLDNNLGQGIGNAGPHTVYAIRFTTGDNPGGYAPRYVEFDNRTAGRAFAVRVCEVDADELPTTACTALEAPPAFPRGTVAFAAPANLRLAAGTTYALWIDPAASGMNLETVGSGAVPSTAAPGWSLGAMLRWIGDAWLEEFLSGPIVFAIRGTAVVGEEVAADWALKPAAVAAGGRFRLLFVSSTKRDATSTDIADYNAHVQTAAAAGHADIQAYSADFTAVGSTATVNARDNTLTRDADPDAPIYWLSTTADRSEVATGYADFWASTPTSLSWNDTSARSESGAATTFATTDTAVFVGTDRDGTTPNLFELGNGTATVWGWRLDTANQRLRGSSIEKTEERRFLALSPIFRVAGGGATPGNRAPTFSPAATTREVAENTAGNMPVGDAIPAAEDLDGDELTYTMEGTNAASFAFDDTTRQIKTKTGVDYDYETQASYAVTVKATDPGGAAGTIDVTITVTNVAEKPARPAAPSVAAPAGTTDRLRATWTKPDLNGGPDIVDYELRRKESSLPDSTFRGSTHSGTTHTFTGLKANTEYEVQVRARNGELDSDWSPSGIATTGSDGSIAVSFGASSYTAAEGGAGATVTVRLSRAPDAATTISLTRENVDGASDDDYSGVPESLTFGTSDTSMSFTVTATDDDDEDAGERVDLGFGDLPAGFVAGRPSAASVNLVDNEAESTRVTFGPRPLNARESSGAARVQLRLTDSRDVTLPRGLDRPVEVPLTVTHIGGATAADYEPLPSSVTFAAGVSETVVRVVPVDDDEDDDGEELRLGLGTLPAGLSPGRHPTQLVRLLDDDGIDTWYVWFERSGYTATENGAGAPVAVVLSDPWKPWLNEPLTIPLEVAEHGGGATPGDYSGVPSGVTIPADATRATFTVRAVDDSDDDDGESVTLALRWQQFPDDLRPGSGPHETVVSLADDDGVTAVEVSFGAAAYTAVEGGSAASVGVRLDRAPGREVRVPLSTTGRGATPDDYSGVPSSVVFGAAQTVASFDVTAVDDSDDDDHESIDIGFGALPAGVSASSPASATVQLEDDDGDTPRYRVRFDTRSSYVRTVWEGSCSRAGARLNRASDSPLALPLAVTHLRGATAADYSDLAANLVFDAGETRSGIRLCGVDDAEVDPGEGLVVGFGALPAGVSAEPDRDRATYDIIDNDGEAGVADAFVAGAQLTVRYAEPLDTGSTPGPKDWVVRTQSVAGARAPTVTAVAVSGTDATLTLGSPAQRAETVTVSYLPWAMHPLRASPDGPEAPPLTELPARNETGLAPAGANRAAAPLPAPPLEVLPLEVLPGGPSLADVASLTGMAELDALDLSGNGIADITPLTALAGLEALDLSGNALADVSALAALSNLRRLNLSGNRIADIAALAALPGLEALDLSGNALADVSALAALSNLRRLNLSGNRIADIAALAALPGLEALDSSGNALADVSALAALSNLRRLDLSDNRIDDAWPLAGLSRLEVLILDGNRVVDIWPLSGLANLRRLDLAGNRVWDASALAGLPLERLDLSGNAAAEAGPLGGLPELLWLDLSGNPVSDATPLGRLTRLRWLWLDAGARGRAGAAPPPP